LLSLRFPIKLALRYILAVRPLPPATQKGHDPIWLWDAVRKFPRDLSLRASSVAIQ